MVVDSTVRTLKALVVDDDPLVCRVVGRQLERIDVEFDGATNADDAEALAREGHYGLVLMDVVMPGADGPPLAARLRDIQPGLPVIYMSGYPREHVAQHGVRDEDPFVEKPLSLRLLREAVKQVTAGMGES
ncbi:MAG: response regulator [Myxococcota bacterium]